MTTTLLTTESKAALSKTIRTLYRHLLDQLLEAIRGEYRLDLPSNEAKLPEARRCRRERLEAWLDEQVRSATDPTKDATVLRQRFLRHAVKETAHTWTNRLALLRVLEHHGLSSPAVLTGGWRSPAYEQEFVHYAGPLTEDDTRGYRDLLEAVFGELSLELPELFGPTGLVALFPMPAATLREVVQALNDPALDSAWGDDMTLGWIYQFWNDPDREELDAKIAGGGKIESHEIASKTQMFTERYMVEWLLENSLGQTWLHVCKQNGWVADAEPILHALDQRRAEVLRKRASGELPDDAAMPIRGEQEPQWKYLVQRSSSESVILAAEASIRDVKLLDPACGSGHFLVSAFGMFVAMYREEAKHRGESWSDEAIAERILANNLHGIDIDPRAIQMAAAALWLKAKLFAPNARLGRLNLVAPCFRLAASSQQDPAVTRLHRELDALGVRAETAAAVIESLSGVDHLGTLLRVEDAIARLAEEASQAMRSALEAAIARWFDAKSNKGDLGLRLEGEQLHAGLRFVSMLSAGKYDVVVGNPPYLGTQRLADSSYIDANYPATKEDLYGTFIDRSLQLLRPSGLASLVTIRSWLFVSHFRALRELVLDNNEICVLADLGVGGFEAVPGVEAVMIVLRKGQANAAPSVALRVSGDKQRELICQSNRFDFDTTLIRRIEGSPIVYQWGRDFVLRYLELPKLGDEAPARVGMKTSDNARFVRKPWEVDSGDIDRVRVFESRMPRCKWMPYIKGAGGKAWVEPLSDVVLWALQGLQVRLALLRAYGQAPQCERLYFVPGVAFTTIARRFLARAHRYRSIFDVAGSSVFHPNRAAALCLLNSERARLFVETINPTINFQVGDVNRLPVYPIANSDEVVATVDAAFTEHESHREPSVEFRLPGPSPWCNAQAWAQSAVDRAEGEPLPPCDFDVDPTTPESHLSFATGVALGRFGAFGEGILATAPARALPAGILFIGPTDTLPDSLAHPASEPIVSAWAQHQSAITRGKKLSLRDWLRKELFAYHKELYENRPIYLPLSSARRSFVALVSIHRWTDNTLETLLVDHLRPALRQLEGELSDLSRARGGSDKQAAAAAERHHATVSRLLEELVELIANVAACGERGAPPVDAKCPRREVDKTFQMELDDGVLINSAALWPLLDPQWKDPKKWWKELCTAEGRKDYDWSTLARRYFPARVEGKCRSDPSLALAHGCFWKYHPAMAYAWELWLQEASGSEVVIDEAEASSARKNYLGGHPAEAKRTLAKELARRERKAAKSDAGLGEEQG